MDRNSRGMNIILSITVALRKESVDRNDAMQIVVVIMCAVALRKESVDRNPPMCTIKPMPLTSLSARRAWIEMANPKNRERRGKSRSPQGERG